MHSQYPIDINRIFVKEASKEEHGSHTDYVFTFINSGMAIMHFKDRVELRQSMFALNPAGMPHTLIEAENLDLWWVGFCPNCLGFDENSPLLRPFRQVRLGTLPVLKVMPDRLAYIQLLFNELKLGIKHKKVDNLEVYRSFLVLLLHEIEKATPIESNVASHSSKVIAALDYIRQNYLEPISLKDVANAIHSSQSHLATLVKKDTGFSVGQWITRNRLTEACSRLLHTNKPITAIVEELGWTDTTHFIRQFKKAYGVTPAAWRKKNK